MGAKNRSRNPRKSDKAISKGTIPKNSRADLETDGKWSSQHHLPIEILEKIRDNFRERGGQHSKVGATQLTSLKLLYRCLSLYCIGFQLVLVNVLFCCNWLCCSVVRVWCRVSSARSAQHLLWLHCLYCVAVLPMMLVVLAGVWDSPAAVCFSADGSMDGARLTW